MKSFLITLLSEEPEGEAEIVSIPVRGEDVNDAKESLAVFFLSMATIEMGQKEVDLNMLRFVDEANTVLEARDKDGDVTRITIQSIEEIKILN